MPSAVSADPGIMKWDTVSTPNFVDGKNDLMNMMAVGANTGMGSEIIDMAVGKDGATIAFIVRNWVDTKSAAIVIPNAATAHQTGWLYAVNSTLVGGIGFGGYVNMLYVSSNSGLSASVSKYLSLARHTNFPGGANLYQVAIAPDDPKVIIVTADAADMTMLPNSGGNGARTGPRSIWYTADGGSTWDLALDGAAGITWTTNETIRCIDISMDYGGKRDLAFGTVSGSANGPGRWFVRSSSGFTTWTAQLNPNGAAGTAVSSLDYNAIKFSPTYNGDSTVALVYTTAGAPAGATLASATLYNVAIRDLNSNTTISYVYTLNSGVEVRDPVAPASDSPDQDHLNNVDLELPSDFSGQSASLRRAYISLDACTFRGSGTDNDGIFRMDDSTQYVLMDTSTGAAATGKTIYSIAYFGTYASGKLLAGERLGTPCTATVGTWFTDSPTTCPIPCWYPALKPTTGAANQGTCDTGGTNTGWGGAIVGWNADGSLGLVSTGSLPWSVFLLAGVRAGSIEIPPIPATSTGPAKWFWYTPASVLDAITNDESAFAISRNNGETWNQLILIDTTIDWFNDVAAAPDCTTIYLASVNRNRGLASYCNEFDSVWRSTINPNVAAPLPGVPPLGTIWERVYTRATSAACDRNQSDLPILRLVPSCTDKKDGEIVGWAAQGASSLAGNGAMAWSPDFGDYWANITPRKAVQDFAFESSTLLYNVDSAGLIQRFPYTGTSWSTNLPSFDTTLLGAHTIVAVPDGKVLVGSGAALYYPAAYSANKGESWTVLADAVPGFGNEHVIFDVDFKNNSFMYLGDDLVNVGSVYRNTLPSFIRWQDNDMMSVINGASGIAWPDEALDAGAIAPPHPVGIFGLVQAWTGSPQPAIYAAHDNITTSVIEYDTAVCRTIAPRDGMPKPGIGWDCLDIFAPLETSNVLFSLEPTSLKYCGCCTLDTNTTLFAIDDESGNWARAAGVRGAYSAATLAGRFNWHKDFCGWSAAALASLGLYVASTCPIGPLLGYTPYFKQGMLWAYTDCLAKKGPVLKSPADKFLVGSDPVSGRNQQVDLAWEQLCLATYYQLQIAKDKDFTLRINPAVTNATVIAAVTGSILLQMDPYNMTSPAAWIAPGSLPEAGAIYWWRIRVARSATQQIAASPWSEARSFVVKAGFIVNTPYYGVQLLSPNHGCLGCKTKPASFSWSPWKEATKYQFDLAKDPEFKQMVVTGTTTTTGYAYQGTLDYSTNYFWRVKALEVNALPIPSDWSATFSFQTEPAPAPPAAPPAEPATPLWVWIIIAIGAILVIVTLILIFKTRRV